MSDKASPEGASASIPAQGLPVLVVAAEPAVEKLALVNGTGNGAKTPEPANEVATDDAPRESKIFPTSFSTSKSFHVLTWVYSTTAITNDTHTSGDATPDKLATSPEDTAMKTNINPDDMAPATSESVEAGTEAPALSSKSKARRKSSGIPEHRVKKLNKKASRAKMSHPDAQPGNYFMIRLKGYPLWPAIVAEESMLPTSLLKSRPNSAAKTDGVWGPGYEEGGNKVNDRSFPVMYLHTNELYVLSNL